MSTRDNQNLAACGGSIKKNLSDAQIFNENYTLISRKTKYEDDEDDICILFGASFFDFVFATSDYAKSS